MPVRIAAVAWLALTPTLFAGEFDVKVSQFVAKHCINCHGPTKQQGSLSLHQFGTETSLVEDRTTWETILERVRAKEMPPQNKPQPSDADRNAFVQYVDDLLKKSSCTGPPNAGRVTLRRLNRAEYDNTIRDLFGTDFKPAQDFPSDDVGYGFDSIGDVLTLSPLLMDKYLSAAESVVDKVFERTQVSQTTQRKLFAIEREYRNTFRNADRAPFGFGKLLTGPGEVSRVWKFEHPGVYKLRMVAKALPAGDELPRVAFKIDGKTVETFQILNVEGRRFGPPYVVEVSLTAGDHRFGFEFLNPYYDAKAKDAKKRDRGLWFDHIEFEGPLNPPPPETSPAYKKLMVASPGKGVTTAEAARRVLTPFARKAYRRAPTAKEIGDLVKLVEFAEKQGDSFDDGIRVAVTAVLVSPHFLYRVELDRPGPANTPQPVTDVELASRLSYFLWSSMPDEDLLTAAQTGKLRQGDNLEKQVRRMLRDPKSKELAENFAGQWLMFRNLKDVTPDEKLFPNFDDALRQAMGQETTLFFDSVVREDRNIFDFIDADYTFVNERLARHYKIPNVTGPEFRRVSLKGTPRGGILTHASILTVTSNPTRTSPVKRGKFIIENILNVTVPPPPPDAGDLPEDDGQELKGSLRQRMEQHRENPTCASCHNRMDPIGFAYENFDALGAWRDKDGKFSIDPSGTLPDGTAFKNPADLRKILKGKQDQFRRCLAEKLLTYATGRGLEFFDRCHVDEIVKQMQDGQDKFSSLILAVVRSEPFQKRNTPKGNS